MANPLLESIKNSKPKAEAQADPEVQVEPQVAPEPVEWKPAKGEVLYECSVPDMPIRTALQNGVEVGFPYMTSDKDTIEFLDAFAEHNGCITITVGE